MYVSIDEMLKSHILENLTKRIKSYLTENYSYLKTTTFNIDPHSLGIDIIEVRSENIFMVSFNNVNRKTFQKTIRNPFFMNVGSSAIVKLSNVSINDLIIKKGLLLGSNQYKFLLKYPAKFMDSYIYALNNPIIDKGYKKEILDNFDSLLKKDPKELLIDKFIENNPFILELSLHLTQLKHQVTLKNIEEEFEQDLKPDVIAYRPLDKCWYIIDYKRAKRNLVKNPGKVRSGFLAEVNTLTYQLGDYIDYFVRSKEQSRYVKEKYGIDVKYPKGIGVIGNLHSDDQEAYLKANRNLPKDINVYPYNYMIDECKRVLEIQ